MIDSHCHLHDQEFFTPEQAEAVIARATAADVTRLITIGTSHADSLAARDFAVAHLQVYWTYGVHPEFAGAPETAALDLAALRKSLQSGPTTTKLVAIGEVGLDYHRPPYDRAAQIKLLEAMLQLARDLDLPLSFHVRDAFDDLWPVLDNFPEARGVMHSFTDHQLHLHEAVRRGFYIGVNGIATFAHGIPLPPLDHMLLETDAPFLAPVPHRGRPNEPAYVPDIARFVAAKLRTTLDRVAEATTDNATQLFKLA
jgi:TatD DNase family protein